MAISTETTAKRFLNITAGTPIAVNFPLFLADEVYVYYGNASLPATQPTDYTVTLGGDFETFTITPTAALLTKINNLIAADNTEVNAITVRRTLGYLTESTPAAVRYTPFTSREFDRTAMRFAQLEERLNRAVVLGERFVGDAALATLQELSADRALISNGAGDTIIPGPTANEIENAQTYATNAAGSATAASGSATAAAGSATKASEWADKAEDSPVETGPNRYSASHWAAKAQAAADAVGSAADISYSNATSGLTATDVQAALDEINDGLEVVALTAIRVYDVAGSPFTWSKPANLNHVVVEVWGGGGGSAGGYGSVGSSGSGGGGGYGKKRIASASLGATETVTVGDGGSGATATTDDATAGGTSSFGSHISCTGGARGRYFGSDNAPGGAGGAPTGADDGINGARGSAGAGGAGLPLGGFSPRGGPGGVGTPSPNIGPPATGFAPGGGAASARGSAQAGADGGAGRIVVYEYTRIN